MFGPAGKNFMRVGLVTHIPDQPIEGGVIDVMQRHGKFNGAKTGGKMTTALTDTGKQVLAKFVGQSPQFVLGKLA